MATSKLLKPTNVTISIPEFTDQPDQRVNSNCIDKEADAINTLSEQIANINNKIITMYETTISSSTPSATEIGDFLSALGVGGTFIVSFKNSGTVRAGMIYSGPTNKYGGGIIFSYYGSNYYKVQNTNGTVTMTSF